MLLTFSKKTRRSVPSRQVEESCSTAAFVSNLGNFRWMTSLANEILHEPPPLNAEVEESNQGRDSGKEVSSPEMHCAQSLGQLLRSDRIHTWGFNDGALGFDTRFC